MKMCGDYDEIHCLRDNCPGIGQCRLCGRSVVSPVVQNDCCICLWPSSPSRLSKSPPQQHRKAWLFSSKSVWQSNFLCLALWCVALLSVSQASTQITTIPTLTTTTSNPVHLSEGRICQSKDIRNRADNLKSLTGCRVIEGFLQIVLIDNANETSFESLSFPELREITGYLLLYRVNGLKSLAKLFPNLSVIRGQDLFMSYAIAIYEMVHLHELGLYTLKDVVRGAIYITKNPMLCFTQTIDWNKIAPSGKGSHVIYENRPGNACPVCPWTNDPSCAVSSTNEPLCWNTDHCQRICPSNCNGLCSMDGKCCHEQCLGGCVEENKQDKCFACKELEIERNCVTACPANFLIYQNRRCVSENSCYRMPRPRVELQNGLHPQSWKPFNNTSCLMECPPGYEEVPTENNHGKVYECRQCSGPCRKVCIAANVESIQSAQKLKGCVVINGSLEIQIRGGTNIVKELEESLSMIEEITGYLKVVRSFPLVSLSFLKKLKLIRGETLESSKYALVVLDNQNLVELWDWSTRKQDEELKIENGRIFFHFNPKLCLYRIKELQTKLGSKFDKVDDLEVAPNSNGDKIACNVSKLNVRTDIVFTRSVVLKWPPFLHYDTRTLLGYVVYYLEAPYQNVSLYDGRDACGGDGWKTDDVESTETTEELSALITNLKPYTQYAYYVKTYTVASESIGAQSDISYFYTLPDTPGPPQHIEATDWTTESVTIKWLPPAEPNGQLSHYIIKYSPNNISGDERLHERNYCENTINMNDLPGKNNNPNNEVVQRKGSDKEKDCNCTVQPEKKPTKIKDEQQIKTMIEFENNLQNIVFVKNPHRKSDNSQKTKRDVSNYDIGVEFPNNTIITAKIPPDSDKNNVENDYVKKIIVSSDKLQYTIKDNLTHFTNYNIEIFVCRLSNKNETTNSCSTKKAMTSGTTLKKDSADKLDESKFFVSSNSSAGSVKISWSEPQNSNGPIVSYQLEYAKVGDNLIPSIKCITRQQFNKSGGSYILSSLLPGNYSFRVRAQSLAGYGEYTSYKYYNIDEMQSITHMQLFIIVILAAVVICVIIILVFFGLHRYYRNKLASTRLFVTCNPDYISCEYQADEWEIPREDIEVLEPLGRGSFGMVYRGIWKKKDSDPVPCAIKTVTENNNIMVRHDFLSEANVMKEFCTTHVVRLYGVVSQGQPAFVLMELMTQGDLKSFLLKHRPEMTADPLLKPPTLRDILRMAIEIADGMAYLSFKKYVHRDLAARNCMVGEKYIVKVGDFGLTRDIYQTDYYRKDSEGMMPIRWMAPESLKHGLFTCFSDVWSYGVVLWEMVTLAAQPYRGENDKNVIAYVSSGGIMEKPHDCPDILYDCMKLCWRFKASERPTFPELVKMFLPCAREEFSKMSFYHNELQSETPRLELPDNGVNESETSERERKQLEQDQITAALRNFGSSNERLAPKADLEEDDDDDDDDEEDSDNGNELQRLRIDDFVYKQRPPNGYMSIHNGNGNINTTMC